MHRAYSFLHVKSIDGEKRIILGTATTPTPDRVGDIVEPLGVQFKNPLPLLLYHNSQKPVGWVKFFKPTDEGIQFEAKLPTIEEPGTVRDRIEEAWTSIKTGLLAGVSIGFRALEEVYMKETMSFRFIKTEVLELSLVAIPAQPDARIETIKSLDIGLAASGTGADDDLKPAGASASSRVVKMRTERPMKKSYADQIAAWEATRAAKSARMDELLTKSGDAGVTMDAAEEQEHDELEADVTKIDAQLVRLRAAEQREKETAVVVKGQTAHDGLQARTGTRITIEKKLPPGIQFARYAMCIAASKGSRLEALDLAKTYYPDDSAIRLMIEKAAVPAANTQTSGWASELVPYGIMDDFIEFLRGQTIVDKFGTNGIPSLRKVPFNVRVSGASAGTTGYWVGEGLPVPVSKMTTITAALLWAKVEALAILTKEEVRFSNPNAETKVRDDIGRAVVERMDIDFIDPGKAASANVSPASITFNTTPIAPSGTNAAAVRKDLATLLATFTALKLNVADIVLVMSSNMALQISMMVNTFGADDFPGLNVSGGTLRGLPVIVSEHLVALGSPDEEIIVAVKAGDIYLADDGVVSVEASGEASVEMLDSSLQQTGIVGTGASMVSLWQSGLLGIKANREVTWKLRRTGAARYIGPAAYAA